MLSASSLGRAFRRAGPVLLALALAAAAAASVLAARVPAELANRTVELAADLEEFEIFALREGLDLDRVLAGLRAAGVTSLALREMTPERLQLRGQATLLSGAELLSASRRSDRLHPLLAELIAAGEVDAAASYLLSEDAVVFDRAREEACRRTAGACRFWQAGGLGVVEVPIHAEIFAQTGLGIWPEDLQAARRHGFYALLRFRDYPGVTPDQIAQAFAAAAEAAPVSSVVFDGPAVLGSAAGSQGLQATAEALKRHGFVLGLIESTELRAHLPQQGMQALLQALDYRAARVYSIPPDYLAKLHPAEAVDIWIRSPEERNIRILYLRPLFQRTYGTRLETTLETMGMLSRGLAREGWRTGPAGVFEPVWLAPWQVWSLVLGAGGMAVLLLTRLLPLGWPAQAALLLAFTGALAGVAAVAGQDLAREAAALVLAVVTPTLALDLVLQRWGRRALQRDGIPAALAPALGAAAADAVLAAAVTIGGALLLAALLGDIRYLLEERFFRGVKVSLVVPPLLVAAAYFWRFGSAGPDGAEPGDAGFRARLAARLRQLRDLADQSVRWRHVLLGAAGLVALALYVGRSGNLTRDVVPAAELALRAVLEDALGVRPRFKEFALGYPALVLGGWMLARRLQGYMWLAAVVGSVGVVSAINSFEHLRTPVLVSLVRSLHGLWLGLVVGAVVTLAAELALRAGRRWARRPGKETGLR